MTDCATNSNSCACSGLYDPSFSSYINPCYFCGLNITFGNTGLCVGVCGDSSGNMIWHVEFSGSAIGLFIYRQVVSAGAGVIGSFSPGLANAIPAGGYICTSYPSSVGLVVT
jgi:hypothetical protein